MSGDRLFDDIDFLQAFNIDPVLISKALEECETELTDLSNDFTGILSPIISKRSAEMFTPTIFKKPEAFCTPHRLLKPHYNYASQKLTNHSYSQPTTPRTPVFAFQQGTPLLSKFEAAMLTTPMLIRTLDDIQNEGRIKDRLSPCPDILQLIDDDSRCTWVKLNHHLEQCSESNITDNIQNEDYKSPPRVFHRARRRTKLMTEEERKSIQRHQREKTKQKRKDRFSNVPRTGTRKSGRTRTQVVRYS